MDRQINGQTKPMDRQNQSPWLSLPAELGNQDHALLKYPLGNNDFIHMIFKVEIALG